MQFWEAVLDVVLLLAAALAMGALVERLRQSALIGYLLAGALVGPGALNWVTHAEVIRAMAELGVALLLFVIGLEFSWKRLRRLGAIALVGGALQMAGTAAAITGIASLFGLPLTAAVAIGVIAAPSSTACVIRVLNQRTETDTPHGRACVSVLLFQDIALIPCVLLLSTLSGEVVWSRIIVTTLLEVGLIGVLVAAVWALTHYVLPVFFDTSAVTRNREIPILLAVVTCLATAYAAHAMDLSPVLGAFVAGILLAETPYATSIRADVSVLRTLFVTLFFTSMGMLADVGWMAEHWPWVAVSVPAALLLKSAIVIIVAKLCRMPTRHAVAAGLCLCQLGEFSFVLGEIAEDGGLISFDQFGWIVSTAVITLLLTPYLVAVSDPVGRALAGRFHPSDEHGQTDNAAETRRKRADHVILIGLGPAGRGALLAIQETEQDVTAVDLNPRAVASVERDGVDALVGDASHGELLEELGLVRARALVVTVPDHGTAMQIIRAARSISPEVRVFARARYAMNVPELIAHNITAIDEESDTGRRMGSLILESLEGADGVRRDRGTTTEKEPKSENRKPG